MNTTVIAATSYYGIEHDMYKRVMSVATNVGEGRNETYWAWRRNVTEYAAYRAGEKYSTADGIWADVRAMQNAGMSGDEIIAAMLVIYDAIPER